MRLVATLVRAVRGGMRRREAIAGRVERSGLADAERRVIADIRLPSSSMLRGADGGSANPEEDGLAD